MGLQDYRLIDFLSGTLHNLVTELFYTPLKPVEKLVENDQIGLFLLGVANLSLRLPGMDTLKSLLYCALL